MLHNSYCGFVRTVDYYLLPKLTKLLHTKLVLKDSVACNLSSDLLNIYLSLKIINNLIFITINPPSIM